MGTGVLFTVSILLLTQERSRLRERVERLSLLKNVPKIYTKGVPFLVIVLSRWEVNS